MAGKTNDVAGDGTTTATILTRAIFKEGCKAVAAGMNGVDVQRGIKTAVEAVVGHLKSASRPISTKDEIAQVATISANGETAVGALIANAMERVGREGVISVQDGKTINDELEVVEGMKLDRGYISPYFITDQKTQKCEYEKPLLLLYDGKISSIESIAPAMDAAHRIGRPLVIVAEDVEGEALAFMIINKLKGMAKSVAVKAPGFGDNRKATLQDLAVLTGAQLISEEVGLKLDQVTVDMLGNCKKVSLIKSMEFNCRWCGAQPLIADCCAVLCCAVLSAGDH